MLRWLIFFTIMNACKYQNYNCNKILGHLEKFLNLSPEERRAMGLAGRAKVESEFDRQIVIRKYREEIRRA